MMALLLAAHAAGSMIVRPGGRFARMPHRHAACLTTLDAAIDPIDIQILQQQLQAVRNLPRVNDDAIDEEASDGCREPSFRRLFTHSTWKRYTGRPTHIRWLNTIVSWRRSPISRSIFPCVAVSFVWALVVASALPVLLPAVAKRSAQMWIPLSLQGTAIGLLLVFRTNNAYLRLAEAREQWGKLLMLVREMTTKISVALPYEVTCEACRYLCAFTWSLRDKLRDGDQRDDILLLLLGAEVSGWVSKQRSRPLAILSRLRRLVHAEYASGALDSQVYYFLETDIKDIDTVVESCERLFSSPIPPNMARHSMRSLTLWILGLPIVMANSMHPLIVALWTANTAFIYLGVEELGAQVEQPSAISHQPSASSPLPSAISHQPSAISPLPSALCHQPSAISHQPAALCQQPSAISTLPSATTRPSTLATMHAQVEQPFAILPLWQLCHLAQLNVEEALSTPDLPLRLNRPSKALPSPLSCQSGNPFGDPNDERDEF